MKLLFVLFLSVYHPVPRITACYNSAVKHDPATGMIVRLQENVWKVNDRDTDTSRNWKQNEVVEVCGNKLTNLNRDEFVWAVKTQ
jgi:hypothetical protein